MSPGCSSRFVRERREKGKDEGGGSTMTTPLEKGRSRQTVGRIGEVDS